MFSIIIFDPLTNIISVPCAFALLFQPSVTHFHLTRNLSYRKDDRVMRPVYGRPANFRESQSTPTATFAKIINGLLFDRSYECAYKI